MKAFVLGIVCALGCGNNASHPDSQLVDVPRLDADPSLAPLVGTWNRAPEQDQALGFAAIAFHADGTYVVSDPGKADQTGTYSVPSAGRVRIVPTGGTAHTQESNFAIANGHMIFGAYLPQGTVSGVVGTWTETTIDNGATTTFTLDLAADHNATYTQMVGTNAPASLAATWAAETNGFGLTFTAVPNTLHYILLGDAAIGVLYFVKA